MSNPPPSQSDAAIWLVYDGDCPFCSAAAHLVRIKQAVGDLHIINARESREPIMADIAKRGLDLNKGIVVRFEDRLYHGKDALHLLALIGSQTGWLNRLNVALFRNKSIVAFAYPVMKAVRNAALFFLGKKPI